MSKVEESCIRLRKEAIHLHGMPRVMQRRTFSGADVAVPVASRFVGLSATGRPRLL